MGEIDITELEHSLDDSDKAMLANKLALSCRVSEEMQVEAEVTIIKKGKGKVKGVSAGEGAHCPLHLLPGVFPVSPLSFFAFI